ncbi:hypothetical protein PoB_005972000 [Plakobranchus ocellatus]|uniref:Uncharacterized protein n=1 Tax=Plakobranchus ocellatus TaxID=259542 RepID=A0AAV4CMB0_9GAST|nr:hypothetical protein PoB_005972000 [Plakobranchus ocellatus]
MSTCGRLGSRSTYGSCNTYASSSTHGAQPSWKRKGGRWKDTRNVYRRSGRQERRSSGRKMVSGPQNKPLAQCGGTGHMTGYTLRVCPSHWLQHILTDMVQKPQLALVLPWLLPTFFFTTTNDTQ